MINLLPPKDKKELTDKKNQRTITILGYAGLICLICLILIVSSLKFFILAQVIAEENNVAQSQKNYILNSLNIKEYIQKINEKLSALDFFYNDNASSTNSLKIITKVLKPEGLYFTNVYLSKGKDNDISMIISGFADTRDNLLIFRDNIEKETKIKNANFSSESWTKAKDINFYLNLTIDSIE